MVQPLCHAYRSSLGCRLRLAWRHLANLEDRGANPGTCQAPDPPLVVAVIVAMGLVSSWLPFLDLRLMTRWFSDGNFWWLSPSPSYARRGSGAVARGETPHS